MLTHDRLLELLRYNKRTGVFKWRVYRSWNARAGDRAGTIRSDGYVQICIDYKLYEAHRLAWFYVTGTFPAQIDHKNTRVSDNNFSNLREATTLQNNWNIGLKKTNTSGFKGVHFRSDCRKWQASIRAGRGSKIYLGLFRSAEEASEVYQLAASMLHGSFAYHG